MRECADDPRPAVYEVDFAGLGWDAGLTLAQIGRITSETISSAWTTILPVQ